MKKLLLIVMCAVCVLTASAQRIGSSSASSSHKGYNKEKKSVIFGVRAGMNISNNDGNIGDYDDFNSRIGFNFGINVDIPVSNVFYLQTGLFVTQKGAEEEIVEDEYRESKTEVKANPLYLQIPVLASFRYDITDIAQLQFNLGPYFAYGIQGTLKITESYEYNDEDNVYVLDFFDDDYGIGGKRFEVGLQIGAGVTVNKFYIGCTYEHGLTNAFEYKYKNNNKYVKDKGKNSNFMINVGYNF